MWISSKGLFLLYQVNVKPSSWILPIHRSNLLPELRWPRPDFLSRTHTCEYRSDVSHEGLWVFVFSFSSLCFRERLRTHSIESSGKLKISPEQHWDFTAEDLKDLGEIGRGAYGSVNNMVHKPSGQIMAVKVSVMSSELFPLIPLADAPDQTHFPVGVTKWSACLCWFPKVLLPSRPKTTSRDLVLSTGWQI